MTLMSSLGVRTGVGGSSSSSVEEEKGLFKCFFRVEKTDNLGATSGLSTPVIEVVRPSYHSEVSPTHLGHFEFVTSHQLGPLVSRTAEVAVTGGRVKGG